MNSTTNAAGKIGALVWLLPLSLLALLGYVTASALTEQPAQTERAPVVSAGGFPRTVVEDSGRRVLIRAKPQRIVAANAGLADILARLVEPERLAAVPFTVDDFAGDLEFFAKHNKIPRFERFTAEALLGLKPDLLLVSSFQDQTTTAAFEQSGIPVVYFEMFRTFAGIRSSFFAVGAAVGEEAKAELLAQDFDARLARVEQAVAGRPRPRVLSYSNYGQGFAVGLGESQDELLRRAGAANALADTQTRGHVNYSFEQLLKLNPDWLVVSGDHGLQSNQVQILLNEASIANLPAIKHRRIAVVPDRFYSTISQYVVDAVEILARQFHPEAFAEDKRTRLQHGDTETRRAEIERMRSAECGVRSAAPPFSPLGRRWPSVARPDEGSPGLQRALGGSEVGNAHCQHRSTPHPAFAALTSALSPKGRGGAQ